MRRLPALLVSMFMIVSGVVACASPSEDAADTNAPKQDEATAAAKDSVTFEASSETKQAVGVTRWGFEGDADSARSTFRGYDEKGVAVVVVEHTIEALDPANPSHVRLDVKMTGTKATGSQKVEMIDMPIPPEQGAPEGALAVAVMVHENTFAPGTDGRAILDRLSIDAKANEEAAFEQMTGPHALLTGKALRPAAGDLVKVCQRLIDACPRQLIQYEIAMAQWDGACSGTELLGKPVAGAVAGGVTVGIIGSVFPAVGTAAGAVGGAIGGAVGGLGSAAYGCWSAGRDAREKASNLRSCGRQNNVSC